MILKTWELMIFLPFFMYRRSCTIQFETLEWILMRFLRNCQEQTIFCVNLSVDFIKSQKGLSNLYFYVFITPQNKILQLYVCSHVLYLVCSLITYFHFYIIMALCISSTSISACYLMFKYYYNLLFTLLNIFSNNHL